MNTASDVERLVDMRYGKGAQVISCGPKYSVIEMGGKFGIVRTRTGTAVAGPLDTMQDVEVRLLVLQAQGN